MNFSDAKDESLLTYYESVRRQVEPTCVAAEAIILWASPRGNMPSGFAKKWTGGD
jgi:hypothetical protein